MQQHSYPSHSRHFVFPAAPVSGLTIEEMVDAADEPGPLRFTSVFEEEEHILFVRWWIGGTGEGGLVLSSRSVVMVEGRERRRG